MAAVKTLVKDANIHAKELVMAPAKEDVRAVLATNNAMVSQELRLVITWEYPFHKTLGNSFSNTKPL